jgi:hypothetical protein
MHIRPPAALLLAVVIALALAVPPAEAMRCGSRLVSEGDPRDKVYADCGPPSGVEAWDEEQYEHFGRPPDPRQYREFERYGSAYRVRTVVRVEVWTYNYGPSRFVDYVRFENGRVRRIESGGYGY